MVLDLRNYVRYQPSKSSCDGFSNDWKSVLMVSNVLKAWTKFKAPHDFFVNLFLLFSSIYILSSDVQLMGWNLILKMDSYLHATEFNLLIPQCSCCNTQCEYFYFISSHEKEDNICSYKKDFNLMWYRIQILSVNCWALKLTR